MFIVLFTIFIQHGTRTYDAFTFSTNWPFIIRYYGIPNEPTSTYCGGP